MSLAIVFPGQGSQSIGMLSELAGNYPLVKTMYQQASDCLGFDLWKLVQDGPEAELNRTQNTQPALLAAGVATWEVWQQNDGKKPEIVAGHSLGEYTALVCAGVLDFSDAVKLVADRGKYMQEAVPEGQGAMAAVLGLDDDRVIHACERISNGQIVAPANFNCPGQVVIAGHTEAVEKAVDAAKTAGAKRAVILPVSVPSHCRLMQDAAGKLAQRLEQVHFSDAAIPVLQNVNAEKNTEAGTIKQALIEQLYRPVRWSESITRMKKEGIKQLIECGPGKVLTGLTKRIDRDIQALPVFDLTSLQTASTAD